MFVIGWQSLFYGCDYAYYDCANDYAYEDSFPINDARSTIHNLRAIPRRVVPLIEIVLDELPPLFELLLPLHLLFLPLPCQMLLFRLKALLKRLAGQRLNHLVLVRRLVTNL